MHHCVHPELPVVLVDDEPMILLSYRTMLRKAGIGNVVAIEDSREVMSLLRDTPPSAVVLDLSMPHLSGIQLLEQITEGSPDIPVIVITATDDLETAVDCMRRGAFDYLVKPVEMNRFLASVRKALEIWSLKKEVSSLKRYLLSGRLEHEQAFSRIVTASPNMRSIFQYAEAIAASQQPVLITGETGTGKELFAQAIHDLSTCRGEFVAINIAGLDDTMFSDSLFGHRKGAFTGAHAAREGLISHAEGGTLFLDEIGDLTEASQIKLLRLLQEREYFPLGSDIARRSDARIIVATNRNIPQMIDAGTFRKDLYYRLRAHQMQIPPLRKRLQDIKPLVEHFIAAAARSLGKKVVSYPKELITLLSTHTFPGNVRELQGMLFDAVARCKGGQISLESFKEAIRNEQPPSISPVTLDEDPSTPLAALFGKFPTLGEADEYIVAEALRISGNNQGIAASLLGITRQALNKRLSKSRCRPET